MSELARTIVGRLREYIGNRRHARRVRVRLPFSLSLLDLSVSRNGSRRPQSIEGHTHDISANGLALIVPAIRIGEHYLAGESRRLQIRLELPGGPVEIDASPAHYDTWEEQSAGTEYRISVRISHMSEADRAHYNEYVTGLLHR